MTTYLGIDVGGRRKGLDVAVLRGDALIAHAPEQTVADVIALAEAHRPAVVGVDSPREAAPDGERSRPAERAFRRAGICHIRYTPDARTIAARRARDTYFEWIEHGFELYRALDDHPAAPRVIEVFPTAAWTRWYGPRAGRPRGAWSAQALAGLRLTGLPARPGQDLRDAIAAARTAQEHDAGRTEAFGAIVVPVGRSG